MSEREQLPKRRRSESFAFEDGNIQCRVQVSRFVDGRPGEIFIDAGKIGSGVQVTVHDAAVAVSIGLQYGVPLVVFQHAMLKLPSGESASVIGRALDLVAGASPVGR
jgi:hypothetical protein